MQTVRVAFRTLLSRPSFAVPAVVTLAIGIAATTTIFSVIDTVVLRPLPLREPDRLAVIWETNPRLPVPVMVVSPPNLADWRQRTRTFAEMGAFQLRGFTVAGPQDAEQLDGARLSPELLSLMGVPPRAGRIFVDGDARDGAPAVALISSSFWQRRFNSSPEAIGASLVVDDQPHTIVGVMPPSFEFPPALTVRGLGPRVPRDIWVPLRNLSPQRGAHNLTVIGRLRPGVTFDGAQRDMDAIARDLAREYPDSNHEWGVTIVPLNEQLVADVRPALRALAGAVAFVLLLACANVANLLLVRGLSRRRELAIRTALGATQGDLVRQLLAEALLLGTSGALLGVGLTFAAVRLVAVAGPATVPRLEHVTVDVRTLAFALGVGGLSALLFGLAPLLQGLKTHIAEWLHERGAGASTPSARRLQQALVVGEVSLALVLLVGAGLLGESFVKLQAVDPGFRQADVLTAKVTLPARRYPAAEAQVGFVRRALADMSRLPGVEAAAMTNAAPLADDREGTSFTIDGAPPWPAGQEPHLNWNLVSPGYFETLGVRLIEGRTFTERDDRDAAPVIIINDTLARRYFPGETPIGRRIRAGFSTQTPREIVGVVATERHDGLGSEPYNGLYVPYAQLPRPSQMTILLRTSTSPESMANPLRQAIAAIDPALAVFDVQPMEEVVTESVSTPRFTTLLIAAFAAVALLLAAVGLYGVISHTVSERTREIGVRVALGAQRTDVLRVFLGRGLALAMLGIAIGLGMAIAVARMFAALLFGVGAANVPTYAMSGVVLLAVAALATWIPARRAMRVDPVVALKVE